MDKQEFGILEEVSVIIIKTIVKCLGNYEALVIEILEDHGIDTKLLENNEWIDMQKWAEAFSEIVSRVNPSDLVEVGEKLAEKLSFKKTGNIVDALKSINDMHGEYYTGKVGGYEFEQLGTNIGQLRCSSPYPCTLDRGIVSLIAKRHEKKARIKHIPDSCRDLGEESCVYLIRW